LGYGGRGDGSRPAIRPAGAARVLRRAPGQLRGPDLRRRARPLHAADDADPGCWGEPGDLLPSRQEASVLAGASPAVGGDGRDRRPYLGPHPPAEPPAPRTTLRDSPNQERPGHL